MHVLIVDDHPVMRFGVRQLIEQRWTNADVAEGESLEQALKLARGQRWDVVVLDLSLPDADGLEGLAQLRRAVPDAPILVLSMHAEAAYARRGRCNWVRRAILPRNTRPRNWWARWSGCAMAGATSAAGWPNRSRACCRENRHLACRTKRRRRRNIG